MGKTTRNFTKGRMNKSVDERLIQDGEYIDAMNIRVGSTELSEMGVVENSKGNLPLTTISYEGTELSSDATCLGAYEDGANETIYWLVHDPNFVPSNTGKLDLILSFNTNTEVLTYHVISVDDGGGENTTLNFHPEHLFTAIDLLENIFIINDDYNPPRRILTDKNYENPSGGVDGFSYNDILVIKKPPHFAPKVELVSTGGQENFLEERFICFAYRYKYENGEYSATSQWTNVAFNPRDFEFSPESYLNDGATNLYNTAEITFNTGGDLVEGIDLLFKDANNSVYKVIEKLNKQDEGYVDNEEVTYRFNNSKIFTILPESELLRLYDNVPLLAKAQTIMGNRVVFGNYLEGYDLIDPNGNPVRFDYVTEKVSESFKSEDITGNLSTGDYNIQGSESVVDAVTTFDLDGIELTEGSLITFNFDFEHTEWGGLD